MPYPRDPDGLRFLALSELSDAAVEVPDSPGIPPSTETEYMNMDLDEEESSELENPYDYEPGTPTDDAIDEVNSRFDEVKGFYEHEYISGALMDELINYPNISIENFGFWNYSEFYEFVTHRETQAAYRELQRDFLTQLQSPNNDTRGIPNHGNVVDRVELSEFNPGTWSYNKPNPDKTNWTCDSHYARFSIRLQVVRRQIGNIPLGPLTNEERTDFVRFDIKYVNLMQKMQAVHDTYVPELAEVGAGN